MAAVKSGNLHKNDTDFIYKIFSWSQADVDKYLTKNGIPGCGPALTANSIDGKAFLNLNYQSVSSWAIPIIKRSKIVALLNDLGPESYRKDAIVKAQISLRLNHVISNIPNEERKISIQSQKLVKAAAPVETTAPTQQMPPSTTIKKPNLPRLGPIIPPKPQIPTLLKKPIPPITNFSSAAIGEIKRPGKFCVENEYLVISADEDISIAETINSHLISERGTTASIVISSDSFTETDDEINDDMLSAAKNSTCPKKKKKVRKTGFIRNLLFSSKTNLLEEKTTQADPFGTPPLPPVRNQNSSRYSSDSNISQSGSDSRQTPPPTLTHRRISSQSATSLSSLAESLPSPSYPPPPVPNATRRLTPVQRDTSPVFGSQTLSPPSPRSQRASPVHSSRSNNITTNFDYHGYPWFFNVDRKRAEYLLRNSKDGTFIVRPSKHGGESASFTLSLQFNNRVFHVLIHKRLDGKLALGSEKNKENKFYSLNELVEFHFYEAMQLHSSQQLAGMTRLTDWPENIT